MSAFSSINVEQPPLYCDDVGGGFGENCSVNATIRFNETWYNLTRNLNITQTGYDLNVSGDDGAGVIEDDETFFIIGEGNIQTNMSSNTLTITSNLTDSNETSRINNMAAFNCSGSGQIHGFDDNLNAVCTAQGGGGGGGDPDGYTEHANLDIQPFIHETVNATITRVSEETFTKVVT
jgi:hypothetical protein